MGERRRPPPREPLPGEPVSARVPEAATLAAARRIAAGCKACDLYQRGTAQALLGRTFRVSRQRGGLVASPLAPFVTATIHPSSILRAPDDEARREEMQRFVEDLRTIAGHLGRTFGP